MEGNHESTESNPQIKVEWKKDDDSDIEDLFIRFEESSYHALLVDGVLYGGKLEVLPAEKQRTGIGTMLLKKLIEAAKERGVHLIYHHAQSLEGLLIIKNKLVVPERKYWDPKNGKELQYEEAVEILQQKKDKGVEDIGTFVQTTTVVDELED